MCAGKESYSDEYRGRDDGGKDAHPYVPCNVLSHDGR